MCENSSLSHRSSPVRNAPPKFWTCRRCLTSVRVLCVTFVCHGLRDALAAHNVSWSHCLFTEISESNVSNASVVS